VCISHPPFMGGMALDRSCMVNQGRQQLATLGIKQHGPRKLSGGQLMGGGGGAGRRGPFTHTPGGTSASNK